ncbi:MAG: hypothetical protein MPJ50_01160 [Pirellulales bacterium]|nr:hypothetical protein [Pirellulales bacterium]
MDGHKPIRQRYSLLALFAVTAFCAILAMGFAYPQSLWVDVTVFITLCLLLYLWRMSWSNGTEKSTRENYRNAAFFGTIYFVMVFILALPPVWDDLVTSKLLSIAHEICHGFLDDQGAPQTVAEFMRRPLSQEVEEQARLPKIFWPMREGHLDADIDSLRGFSSVGHCFFVGLLTLVACISWRRHT